MRTLTRWRLPLLTVVALAAGAAVGGGTFAAWNTTNAIDGAVITAGDLDVTDGEAAWQETSGDVDAAPHAIDPSAFLLRQGDTVTADYDVTAAIDGENMRAAVHVAWTRAPELPSGVTATYELLDDSGTSVSAAFAVGDGGAVLDVLDASATATADYTLRFEIDASGLSDRFGPDSIEQVVDLGDFSVTLEQIREGGDFE